MNKIKFLVVAFFFISFASFAQTNEQATKIGYANVEEILSKMPERASMQKELEVYGQKLQEQFATKENEYNTKLQAYQKGASTMDKVVREDKERELVNLEQSIQKFQYDAQMSIREKEQSLIQPVLVKIENAIKEVAKENGYLYILSEQAILEGPESGSINNLVFKKLGVDPSKQPAAAQQAQPQQQPAAAKPATTTPAKKKK
ncbi:OmpH family outer membrane protein [Pontibacter ramchanderi]|uniref:Periplasmic chaperone for outer membrane proteins Skp n=1 Tax=Pontibacter ramchanderi TaxID=1179743 RepID=A0A2N3U728_9BACT|nr:OmpH family outer membrane protein [Pontibacter ramchanderi]PKV62548.1 periplasmic chaperone for outer membrane proteins Skp [Pontibacter ramchanderi]